MKLNKLPYQRPETIYTRCDESEAETLTCNCSAYHDILPIIIKVELLCNKQLKPCLGKF